MLSVCLILNNPGFSWTLQYRPSDGFYVTWISRGESMLNWLDFCQNWNKSQHPAPWKYLCYFQCCLQIKPLVYFKPHYPGPSHIKKGGLGSMRKSTHSIRRKAGRFLRTAALCCRMTNNLEGPVWCNRPGLKSRKLQAVPSPLEVICALIAFLCVRTLFPPAGPYLSLLLLGFFYSVSSLPPLCLAHRQKKIHCANWFGDQPWWNAGVSRLGRCRCY